MIDRSDLDFVIVASPTGLHAEIVKYAINKGLHVFVEKPFSLNSTQGQGLVAMISDSDLVGQVGYVIRFNDVFYASQKIARFQGHWCPSDVQNGNAWTNHFKRCQKWLAFKEKGRRRMLI